MKVNNLYKKQEMLDAHILSNGGWYTGSIEDKEVLFDKTKLALLVELAELANTTRCFKHWSTKGMMDKEIVLDELADIWHFYLSIGNQVGMKWELLEYEIKSSGLIKEFNKLFFWCSRKIDCMSYHEIGDRLYAISMELNFTDEEVEQAYFKKHEENYKRQREGY